MRIDLANGVKLGDIVYNCFMDKLVVTSIHKDVADTGGFHKIVFGTIDTRLHKISYDSSDIYLEDLEGESDDEKSWVEWAKDNRDFFDEFDHIETMKEIYKMAFCNGFEHKRKITYEEMMQK
jgi:hypothetical protein